MMDGQPWGNDTCHMAVVYRCPVGPVIWSMAPTRRLCIPCHIGIVGPLPTSDTGEMA